MSKKKSWWSYYSDHWWDDNNESEESSDIIDGGDKFSHCRYPHHSGYGSYYRSSLDWGRRGSLVSSSYSIWDSGTTSDSVNKAELLSKLFKSIRDIVVILDFPFPVDIRFAQTAYYNPPENSRRLQVPTNVIDRSDYDRDEKTKILCGLGIHEACHLKFTEYRIVKTIEERSWLGTGVLEIDSDRTRTFLKFAKNLFNILEDTRIEDRMLTERPGYADFLEAEKKYRFDLFKKSFDNDLCRRIDDPKDKFLYNLIAFIRKPDEIRDIKEFGPSFVKLKQILDKMPENTKDTFQVATKIVLEAFISLSDSGKTSSTTVLQYLSHFNKILEKSNIYEEIYYGADTDSGIQMKYDSMSSCLREGHTDLVSKIISGVVDKTGKDNIFFENMTYGNEKTYNTIKSEISKYVPGIKKMVTGVDKNYTFNIYGCRNGKLDENKLAEAYQGVTQVYMRQGKVTTNKTTVCVLVDESGSMGCSARGCYHDKAEIARKAAILLNEALGNLSGVDFYMYGHSGDEHGLRGETNLRIYKEPGNIKINKYAITDIQARCENRDGTAIKAVAERVRKFTDSNVLMFVISDGCPSARNYVGDMAIKDTHDKVQEVKKMGFSVVQVCIDDVYGCNEMFEHVISLQSDVANFPKKLGQVIKKAIVADKKTIIT